MEGFPSVPQVGEWGLDPRYKPPVKDSGIQIRFMGNTARVVDLQFIGQIDPYQLLAAAKRLEQFGLRMLDVADAQEAGRGLQVASSIPSGLARPGDGGAPRG